MTKHITTPLSPFLSLLDTAYADTLLSCCVLRYANAGSTNHSQIHHLYTCSSDPRVLVQGSEADETVPPSAETFSQSDKTDKTVQLSDKSGPPSPKAPRTRRALSQTAQRRTPHWTLYPLLLRNLRYSNTWSTCTSVPCLIHYSGDCH
jgi:hypothetical protein